MNLVKGAALLSGQNTPEATEGPKTGHFSVSLTGLHQSHKQKS